MRHLYLLGMGVFVTATIQIASAKAPETAKSPMATVEAFIDAQTAYDQTALNGLTTNDYVEVSPIGEIDPKARMLSFYAQRPTKPAPTVTVAETSVRRVPGGALILARLNFARPAGARTIGMRASFTLQPSGSTWKIAFVQYTPIHAPN